MNKCWLLLKVQLLGFFNINRLLHTHDKKDKNRLVMMGIVMLVVLALMIGYSIAMTVGCVYLGLTSILPQVMLMTCAAVTVITTFLKSNGVLFSFKDYDMVMSMPIKNNTVVLSRVLSVYIMNFLLSCVVMLPSIIVYGTAMNTPLSVWLMMALSPFLAPLLPMTISMIVGVAITAVSIRFRYRHLLTNILSVGAILAVIGISFSAQQNNADQMATIVSSLSRTIHNTYPPAALFAGALVNTDWGSFAQFACISVGVAVLFVMLLSVFYNKINSALFAVRIKSNFRMGTLKTSTPFKALYVKELRRLFTCPVYLINSTIGAILLVVVSVAFLFLNTEQMEAMFGIPDIMGLGRLIAPWAVSVFVGISSTTASSVSLEGKSRWLMCSMPVSAKTVFDSKIAVNLTVLIPSVLISGVLMAVSLQTSPIETVALFVIPLAYSFFIAVVGLAFNLKYPKYDWTSEYYAVKQSISVICTVGVGLIIAIIFCGLAFLFRNNPAIMLLIAIVTIIVSTTGVYRKLREQTLYI